MLETSAIFPKADIRPYTKTLFFSLFLATEEKCKGNVLFES